MKRFLIWIGGLVVIGGIVGTLAMGSPVMPERRSSVPTAKVVRGPLKLTVYATGELRAGRTMNVMAPPAGGSLRIVKLVPTGMPVKKDDVVIEFDPADQIFAVEQAKSDLAEADQQIVKMKADTAVTASQDKLNLMTARFDEAIREMVRARELDPLSPSILQSLGWAYYVRGELPKAIPLLTAILMVIVVATSLCPSRTCTVRMS